MGALDVCGHNDPRMDNLYLNLYIFWKYILSNDSIHIIKSGVFVDVPFLYKQHMWKRYIKDYYKSIFKALLDDDFYVYCTNVDEYYMAGTRPYNEYHFPHDVLIYGYDEEKQLYYIATYDNTGHYNKLEVSMDCFDKAWYSKYNRNYREDVSEGFLQGFKIEEAKDYVEDLNQIINDLKIYIDSKDVENENKPAAYGMKVYKHISDYISRGIVREIVFKDCRMLKLVSEHKALMLKRFEFLQNNQIISEQMVNDYKNIYTLSENTRMLQLKYIVTKNDNILFEIRDNVSRIADEEFRLLSKIK